MKTPIAFLIFNRPDTTRKVFEVIRQVKPPQLLVVADGPRLERPNEAENCAVVRSIIERVDWDCKVLTNYSEVNLGCKKRISSGLDWVFNTVEEAIILEDDCLPHATFFRFCKELLEKYRNDTRIMHIGGNNYNISGRNLDDSYYFSRANAVWGWASWRRAWQYFDVDMSQWPTLVKENRLVDMLGSQKEAEIRYRYWSKVYAGDVNAWSYQWHLACLCQGAYSVVPNRNLVSNIGFNQDSTHTVDSTSPFANLETHEMKFPLTHPKFIAKDSYAYNLYFRQLYSPRLTDKISIKLKKVASRLKSAFKLELPRIN